MSCIRLIPQVITKRHKSLEERLVVLGVLSDDIDDLLNWITTTRKQIDETVKPPSDIPQLIQQISGIKVRKM